MPQKFHCLLKQLALFSFQFQSSSPYPVEYMPQVLQCRLKVSSEDYNVIQVDKTSLPQDSSED